jgi:hypothetical protein
MFPRAYAIPTQWPTNVWQREAADRSIAELLAPYHDRILDPVYSLSASKLLLQRQLSGGLPSPLGQACRAIAKQVAYLLQLPIVADTATSTTAAASARAAANSAAQTAHEPMAIAA